MLVPKIDINTGEWAVVWLAAHWERRLNRNDYVNTPLLEILTDIVRVYTARLTFRQHGHMILGASRVLKKKLLFHEQAVSQLVHKMEQMLRSTVLPAIIYDDNIMMEGMLYDGYVMGEHNRLQIRTQAKPEEINMKNRKKPRQSASLKDHFQSRWEDITLPPALSPQAKRQKPGQTFEELVLGDGLDHLEDDHMNHNHQEGRNQDENKVNQNLPNQNDIHRNQDHNMNQNLGANHFQQEKHGDVSHNINQQGGDEQQTTDRMGCRGNNMPNSNKPEAQQSSDQAHQSPSDDPSHQCMGVISEEPDIFDRLKASVRKQIASELKPVEPGAAPLNLNLAFNLNEHLQTPVPQIDCQFDHMIFSGEKSGSFDASPLPALRNSSLRGQVLDLDTIGRSARKLAVKSPPHSTNSRGSTLKNLNKLTPIYDLSPDRNEVDLSFDRNLTSADFERRLEIDIDELCLDLNLGGEPILSDREGVTPALNGVPAQIVNNGKDPNTNRMSLLPTVEEHAAPSGLNLSSGDQQSGIGVTLDTQRILLSDKQLADHGSLLSSEQMTASRVERKEVRLSLEPIEHLREGRGHMQIFGDVGKKRSFLPSQLSKTPHDPHRMTGYLEDDQLDPAQLDLSFGVDFGANMDDGSNFVVDAKGVRLSLSSMANALEASEHANVQNVTLMDAPSRSPVVGGFTPVQDNMHGTDQKPIIFSEERISASKNSVPNNHLMHIDDIEIPAIGSSATPNSRSRQRPVRKISPMELAIVKDKKLTPSQKRRLLSQLSVFSPPADLDGVTLLSFQGSRSVSKENLLAEIGSIRPGPEDSVRSVLQSQEPFIERRSPIGEQTKAGRKILSQLSDIELSDVKLKPGSALNLNLMEQQHVDAMFQTPIAGVASDCVMNSNFLSSERPSGAKKVVPFALQNTGQLPGLAVTPDFDEMNDIRMPGRRSGKKLIIPDPSDCMDGFNGSEPQNKYSRSAKYNPMCSTTETKRPSLAAADLPPGFSGRGSFSTPNGLRLVLGAEPATRSNTKIINTNTSPPKKRRRRDATRPSLARKSPENEDLLVSSEVQMGLDLIRGYYSETHKSNLSYPVDVQNPGRYVVVEFSNDLREMQEMYANLPENIVHRKQMQNMSARTAADMNLNPSRYVSKEILPSPKASDYFDVEKHLADEEEKLSSEAGFGPALGAEFQDPVRVDDIENPFDNMEMLDIDNPVGLVSDIAIGDPNKQVSPPNGDGNDNPSATSNDHPSAASDDRKSRPQLMAFEFSPIGSDDINLPLSGSEQSKKQISDLSDGSAQKKQRTISIAMVTNEAKERLQDSAAEQQGAQADHAAVPSSSPSLLDSIGNHSAVFEARFFEPSLDLFEENPFEKKILSVPSGLADAAGTPTPDRCIYGTNLGVEQPPLRVSDVMADMNPIHIRPKTQQDSLGVATPQNATGFVSLSPLLPAQGSVVPGESVQRPTPSESFHLGDQLSPLNNIPNPLVPMSAAIKRNARNSLSAKPLLLEEKPENLMDMLRMTAMKQREERRAKNGISVWNDTIPEEERPVPNPLPKKENRRSTSSPFHFDEPVFGNTPIPQMVPVFGNTPMQVVPTPRGANSVGRGHIKNQNQNSVHFDDNVIFGQNVSATPENPEIVAADHVFSDEVFSVERSNADGNADALFSPESKDADVLHNNCFRNYIRANKQAGDLMDFDEFAASCEEHPALTFYEMLDLATDCEIDPFQERLMGPISITIL